MKSDELEGCVCACTCMHVCTHMWSFVWRALENDQKMQYDSSGLRTQNIMSGAIILCAIETRRPGCGLEFNQKPVCRRWFERRAPTSVSWGSARMKAIPWTFSMKEQRKAGPRSVSRACSPLPVIADGNQSWIHVLTNRGGQKCGGGYFLTLMRNLNSLFSSRRNAFR